MLARTKKTQFSPSTATRRELVSAIDAATRAARLSVFFDLSRHALTGYAQMDGARGSRNVASGVSSGGTPSASYGRPSRNERCGGLTRGTNLSSGSGTRPTHASCFFCKSAQQQRAFTQKRARAPGTPSQR